MAENDFSKTIHDLRSSLSSVHAVSEILQDYPEINGSQRNEFLSIIIQEAERMAGLIDQVAPSFTGMPTQGAAIYNMNVEF